MLACRHQVVQEEDTRLAHLAAAYVHLMKGPAEGLEAWAGPCRGDRVGAAGPAASSDRRWGDLLTLRAAWPCCREALAGREASVAARGAPVTADSHALALC